MARLLFFAACTAFGLFCNPFPVVDSITIPAAFARDPVQPPQMRPKESDLQAINRDLKAMKDEKKRSEKALKRIEKDLKSNKKRFIALGRAVQKNEKAVLDLELSIQKVSKDKAQLKQKIEASRATMADMVLAMERMSQVPMIAMAARPGAPLDNAQGALVMQDITRALSKRAEEIRADSLALEDLLKQFNKQKAELQSKGRELDENRAELKLYLKKKEALYKRSQSDIAKKTRDIDAISKRSHSMHELFKQLKIRNEKRAQQAVLNKKEPRTAGLISRRPNKPPKGKFLLPISGQIKVSYGQKDHLDAPSKGLWIEGKAGGLVVAPMSGKVSFVGKFKSYGNIIIIEHSGHYHSLIAGLETITAAIDSKVDSGEPIGYLKNRSRDALTDMVYFELRKSGKVINPKNRIGNL